MQVERADGCAALARIAMMLGAHEGRPHHVYKPTTLRRRVERRRALREVTLEEYVEILDADLVERAALIQELRIGFTRFFRDPEAFAALAAELAARLADRRPDEPVRIWCAGCATGEEAYSLAILLDDVAADLKQTLGIRIFATDVDERALRHARAGLFEPGAVAGLPAGIWRHFEVRGHRYRIKQHIRRRVVFGRHDMLTDPPFRNLDLVSCRNVMIYLEPQAQEQLLARFHAGLNPDGSLFLGRCEAPGPDSRHFEAVDRDHRIFERRDATLAVLAPPASLRVREREAGRITAVAPEILPSSLAAAPCALVNDDADVLLAHGDLDPLRSRDSTGPLANLLGDVAVELRAAVSVCLRESAAGVNPAIRPVLARGRRPALVVTARRLAAPSVLEGLTLVSFEPRAHERPTARPPRSQAELEERLSDLTGDYRELRATTEGLRRENQALRRQHAELHAAFAGSNVGSPG